MIASLLEIGCLKILMFSREIRTGKRNSIKILSSFLSTGSVLPTKGRDAVKLIIYLGLSICLSVFLSVGWSVLQKLQEIT